MALTLGILLPLSLLALGGSTASGGRPAPTDSPGRLHYELPPIKYETPDSYTAGPIAVLFRMVHVFVHVVQPHSFPEGTCELQGPAGCLHTHKSFLSAVPPI